MVPAPIQSSGRAEYRTTHSARISQGLRWIKSRSSSSRTVFPCSPLTRIVTKLNARNRVDAIRIATEAGWI
ncbi:hypothetical protein [Micromonospora sp. DT229]|uniref:hypothetical protein n=1 Tax=Micromonospora sp. DT229 TaxID=3393430 RepID=UPI003CF12509